MSTTSAGVSNAARLPGWPIRQRLGIKFSSIFLDDYIANFPVLIGAETRQRLIPNAEALTSRSPGLIAVFELIAP